MLVPHLPQEVVEEIIDVFTGDTKNLLSCSIVSTSWVHRCRHHLFADIKLHSLAKFQSWFRTSLGQSSHHVRSLDLSQDEKLKWIAPDTLATIVNDFTSFYNVRSLLLTGLDLTLFDQHSLIRFFGHFSEHLTSLSIECSTVDPDTLLFFVCMFPRLDDLKVDCLTIRKALIPCPRPPLTPRFRGKLTLLNIRSNGTTVTAPFLSPPLSMAFNDVCVENCRFETPKSLKDLFVACQETVKKVKVSRIFLDDTSQAPLIDLSSFKGLEEVGLSLIRIRRPNQWIGAILQTVVSKRLRKITFDLDFPCDPPEIDSEIDLDRWSGLDAMFLTMAGMLDGTGEKLEIVFNALASNVDGELKPVEPGRFLERCRAKAAVRFEYCTELK